MFSQDRRQALAARLFEHIPDFDQRGHYRSAILAWSPASLRLHPFCGNLTIQDPDQVLSVVSGALLRLIQQPAPATVVCLAVLLSYLGKILLASVHVHLLEVPCPTPIRVTFLRDPTEMFWVTF